MYNSSSLYGNYRTRTFAEIYTVDDEVSEQIFLNEWNYTPFNKPLTSNIDLSLVFYLLYARYGNSHIASSDENRFKYQLYSTIFQYGPAWHKQLQLQAEVQNLTIEQAREGSRTINNIADNPSVAPSTLDTEELQYVNNQTVTKNTRSTADAIALINALLQQDVTEEFISKFKKLFLTIVEPECPLWYTTYPEEES